MNIIIVIRKNMRKKYNIIGMKIRIERLISFKNIFKNFIELKVSKLNLQNMK